MMSPFKIKRRSCMGIIAQTVTLCRDFRLNQIRIRERFISIIILLKKSKGIWSICLQRPRKDLKRIIHILQNFKILKQTSAIERRQLCSNSYDQTMIYIGKLNVAFTKFIQQLKYMTQEIEVGYLRLTSIDKGFMQHKRCFKQCVQNMTIPNLSASQYQCVKNCLFRFNSSERIMIEKIKQTMQTFIAGDPNLKQSLKSQNNLQTQ